MTFPNSRITFRSTVSRQQKNLAIWNSRTFGLLVLKKIRSYLEVSHLTVYHQVISLVFLQSRPKYSCITIFVGTTRINFCLKRAVALDSFVQNPFFTHVRNVQDESVTYSCKVLDLTSLPQATIGSVVLVHVSYTHNELSLKQIDNWMKIYGDIKIKSRL